MSNQISPLESAFDSFLETFEKEPVSYSKALELEQRFEQALQRKAMNRENGYQYENVQLNIHKILEKRKTFTLANIPDKALDWASFFLNAAVGILFLTVGFFMIVTPATADMEVVTLFYFNQYDGFTLLDLIALIIVIFGIYFLIRAFVRRDRR